MDGKCNPNPNFTHFGENLVKRQLALRGQVGYWIDKGFLKDVTLELNHDGEEFPRQRKWWWQRRSTDHPKFVVPFHSVHGETTFPSLPFMGVGSCDWFRPKEYRQESSALLPDLIQ